MGGGGDEVATRCPFSSELRCVQGVQEVLMGVSIPLGPRLFGAGGDLSGHRENSTQAYGSTFKLPLGCACHSNRLATQMTQSLKIKKMDVHFCAHVLPAGSVKHARDIGGARKTTTSTARMVEKVREAHNGKKMLFFHRGPSPPCLSCA